MNLQDIIDGFIDQHFSKSDIDIYCKGEHIDRAEFCNRISLKVATLYNVGIYDYVYCSDLMNALMSLMTDIGFLCSSEYLPEPAYAIFCAFDEGEYIHEGDTSDTVPSEKYTKSMIELTLKNWHKENE